MSVTPVKSNLEGFDWARLETCGWKPGSNEEWKTARKWYEDKLLPHTRKDGFELVHRWPENITVAGRKIAGTDWVAGDYARFCGNGIMLERGGDYCYVSKTWREFRDMSLSCLPRRKSNPVRMDF